MAYVHPSAATMVSSATNTDDEEKKPKKWHQNISDWWTGLPVKLRDLIVGTAITVPVFIWLQWLGPEIGIKVFEGTSLISGTGEKAQIASLWVYAISDAIGLLLGPAIYYLFFPSVEPGKTKTGFFLAIVIAVVVHGVWLYENWDAAPDASDKTPQQMAWKKLCTLPPFEGKGMDVEVKTAEFPRDYQKGDLLIARGNKNYEAWNGSEGWIKSSPDGSLRVKTDYHNRPGHVLMKIPNNEMVEVEVWRYLPVKTNT